MEITETSISRPDDSAVEQGTPIQPTVSEVQNVLEELKRLQAMSPAAENDFFKQTENALSNGILQNDECLNMEVDHVRQTYRDWANERELLWKEHLKAKESDSIIQSAKQTLRDLLDEEERLSYFKHSTQVEQSAWLAPRTRAESKWSRLKEWRKDIKALQEKKMKQRDTS